MSMTDTNPSTPSDGGPKEGPSDTHGSETTTDLGGGTKARTRTKESGAQVIVVETFGGGRIKIVIDKEGKVLTVNHSN